MANYFPLIVDAANTANSIIKELPNGDKLDFTGSGIVNLPVANLGVTGGSNGQVLRTDGSANLSWYTVPTVAVTPGIEFTAAANGVNTAFTSNSLTVFANQQYAAVFRKGVLLAQSDYTISGNTLTVIPQLITGDLITVAPVATGVANGIITFANYTTTQKNALTSVPAGSVVFDTTLGKLSLWDGSAWSNGLA